MARSARHSQRVRHPNDLMDKRDALIDDLSTLGNVSVIDPGNGLLQVTFGERRNARWSTVRR